MHTLTSTQMEMEKYMSLHLVIRKSLELSLPGVSGSVESMDWFPFMI